MTVIRLPNVSAFKDRHGKTRYRFRRRGYRTVYLPGEPGTPAFMEAYQDAMSGAVAAFRPIGEAKVPARSLSAVAVAYYASARFQRMKPGTQRQKRMVIERFRAKWGLQPIAALKQHHVQGMMDALALQPGAANIRLKVLRAMLAYAEDAKLIPKGSNPAAGVPVIAVQTDGFRQWTEAEIAQYEAFWPSGTKQRLALALLLYTTQRRSDVIKWGRQHVASGELILKQQKTGTDLTLPILPELQAELAHVRGQMTFLTTEYGKPFSVAGFGNRFRQWCRQAGLEGLGPHGLRKAGATRLADNGASEKELMAWTGIKDPKTLEIYIKRADQKRLAAGSKHKLGTNPRLPAAPELANGKQDQRLKG